MLKGMLQLIKICLLYGMMVFYSCNVWIVDLVFFLLIIQKKSAVRKGGGSSDAFLWRSRLLGVMSFSFVRLKGASSHPYPQRHLIGGFPAFAGRWWSASDPTKEVCGQTVSKCKNTADGHKTKMSYCTGYGLCVYV